MFFGTRQSTFIDLGQMLDFYLDIVYLAVSRVMLYVDVPKTVPNDRFQLDRETWFDGFSGFDGPHFPFKQHRNACFPGKKN